MARAIWLPETKVAAQRPIAAQSGRTPMVYVAANDGMLHALYSGTSAIDPNGGKAAWAFIPTHVLPNLFKLWPERTDKSNHQSFMLMAHRRLPMFMTKPSPIALQQPQRPLAAAGKQF